MRKSMNQAHAVGVLQSTCSELATSNSLVHMILMHCNVVTGSQIRLRMLFIPNIWLMKDWTFLTSCRIKSSFPHRWFVTLTWFQVTDVFENHTKGGTCFLSRSFEVQVLVKSLVQALTCVRQNCNSLHLLGERIVQSHVGAKVKQALLTISRIVANDHAKLTLISIDISIILLGDVFKWNSYSPTCDV